MPQNDYYKHESHHFYHAGPPRVYQVHVPVTQKPVTVHVPQNVPVNFVPVQVPTQDLGPLSVIELDPFGKPPIFCVQKKTLFFSWSLRGPVRQEEGAGEGGAAPGDGDDQGGATDHSVQQPGQPADTEGWGQGDQPPITNNYASLHHPQ